MLLHLLRAAARASTLLQRALAPEGPRMTAPARPFDPPRPAARGRSARLVAGSRGVPALLGLPLAAVFTDAFAEGLGTYLARDRRARRLAAIRLTLLVAAIAVPLNAVFGVAAAWCIAKFEFRGKPPADPLIDLPFSVSPVVSGLVCVLLFGAAGLVRPLAAGPRHPDHLRRCPGLVLATILRHLPLRRPRADPADAGAGRRRGGRGARRWAPAAGRPSGG